MGESVTLSINCATLIGRAGHLATLQQFVEQAKRGEGYLALVSGEAGIGKSRLVAEAKTYAALQGFFVLQGNCFPTDISYPYAPLLDLLRTFFSSHLVAIPAAKLDILAREIFPLLPELVPDQTVQPSTLDPEQEKHRLFAVLANFFIDLSTRSPILFVIEDVHWSDRTSLDFLHYLVRHSASHPFLLLVTYRYDEIPLELRSWLAQLKRERLAQEIQLAPLLHNDVDTMFAAIFDQRHTSFDMRRFLHGELLDTLYTLAEQFAFRHALTRQAIYTQLLVRERTLLHRTIAETMEQFPQSALDAHLEDLAYHFYQGRVWQKAFDYTQRAGEKALRLYTHRAAIDYFTWALDAADRLSLLPAPSLYSARGQAHETLGEFEQAQTDTLLSAAGLAEVFQDAENAVSIAREIGHRSAEAYALFPLGLYLGSQGEYGRALATGRQSLDIAEEIEHRQWQTSAHTVLGGIYSGMLAFPQAREHFEQALALAVEIGSLVWTRVATGYLASAAILLHDLPQAEKLLHAALNSATLAQTMAQRLTWFATVELALAQGHPAHALELIDQWTRPRHKKLLDKSACVS